MTDAQIPQIGFFGQPAGERPALFCGGALEYVEIDPRLGHVDRTRLIRKSTSRGTGRPVLPFLGPAEPGSARDVEVRPLQILGELPQERSRGAGAALASADIGDIREVALQCSTYSSPIGSRQARVVGAHARGFQFIRQRLVIAHQPLKWLPRATMQAPVSVATSITAAGLKRRL